MEHWSWHLPGFPFQIGALRMFLTYLLEPVLLWFGWFGLTQGLQEQSTVYLCPLSLQQMRLWLPPVSLRRFFNVLKGKKSSVPGFCIGAIVGLAAINLERIIFHPEFVATKKTLQLK